MLGLITMDTIQKIQEIMRDVFEDDDIVLSPDTTMEEIEEQDKVNYVRLILAIQDDFEVKLSIEQTNRLRTVGELVRLVESEQLSKPIDFIKEFKKIPPEDQRDYLTAHIQSEINRVLGFEPSGLKDRGKSFTSLGMDSLMMLDVKDRLQTSLGYSLPLTLLSEYPTLDMLVEYIFTGILGQEFPGKPVGAAARTTGEYQVLSTHKKNGFYPQLHNQKELYVWHEQVENKACMHLYFVYRIRSRVDAAAMRQAFHALMDRHEALRIAYTQHGTDWMQQVRTDHAVDFEAFDDPSQPFEEIAKAVSASAREPFELEQGRVLRGRLFNRGIDDHILSFVAHHIAMDALSWSIVLDELWRLYQAYDRGVEPGIPPVDGSFTDFIDWQTTRLDGVEGERLWVYWQEQLEGNISRVNFPTDHPRPMVNRHYGAGYPLQLDVRLTSQLRELARAGGSTLNALIMAVFQALLYRRTGNGDFSIGMHTANRVQSEFSRTVGYLADIVPIRARISSGMSFGELLQQTTHTLMAAMKHQGYPLGLLAKRFNLDQHPSYSPIDVWFTMLPLRVFHDPGLLLHPNATSITRGGLRLEAFDTESHNIDWLGVWYDLELNLMEGEDIIFGALVYNKDLFEETTIAELVHQFKQLLESIVAETGQII